MPVAVTEIDCPVVPVITLLLLGFAVITGFGVAFTTTDAELEVVFPDDVPLYVALTTQR